MVLMNEHAVSGENRVFNSFFIQIRTFSVVKAFIVRYFNTALTQISTFSVPKPLIVAKRPNLSQLKVSRENFHYHFVCTQVSTFSVVMPVAYIVGKSAFLSQNEVSFENGHFKSAFTQISTFNLVRAFIVAKYALSSKRQ